MPPPTPDSAPADAREQRQREQAAREQAAREERERALQEEKDLKLAIELSAKEAASQRPTALRERVGRQGANHFFFLRPLPSSSTNLDARRCATICDVIENQAAASKVDGR